MFIGTTGRYLTSNGISVAYCFAEVAGFSKFGSYTGNGSTNGPTITTNFEPAFVMLKNTSQAATWIMLDNKRNTSNPINSVLSPDRSAAEDTNALYNVNFLGNGFQLINSNSAFNTNGDTYIYIAFANQF